MYSLLVVLITVYDIVLITYLPPWLSLFGDDERALRLPVKVKCDMQELILCCFSTDPVLWEYASHIH